MPSRSPRPGVIGDLSENAEFDAAVEAQGMLQAKINDLQDKLGRAFIVDKTTMPTDRVVFGSKVRVLDLDLNEEEDFILVGPGDEDYDQNKILLSVCRHPTGAVPGEPSVPVPRHAAETPRSCAALRQTTGHRDCQTASETPFSQA